MVEVPPNNVYISEPEYVDAGLYIRTLWDKTQSRTNRPQIVLVIDENTTPKKIKDNWSSVKKALSEIDKLQGTDLESQKYNELYGLFKWRKEGMSWGTITMMLNYLAVATTCRVYEGVINSSANQEAIDEGMFAQDIMGGPLSVSASKSLLINFFFLKEPIDELISWIEQRIEDVSKGQWNVEISKEPFTTKLVTEKVKYFEKRVKLGKIIIPDRDSIIDNTEHIFFMMYRGGYFKKADKILDKKLRKDWERSKKLLQRWVIKLVDNQERNPQGIRINFE